MSAPPANAAARNILSLSPTPKRAVPTTSHSALADSVTQFALGASDHTDLADQLLGTSLTYYFNCLGVEILATYSPKSSLARRKLKLKPLG